MIREWIRESHDDSPSQMAPLRNKRRGANLSYRETAATVLGELLWSTRCILCDEPDSLLCERCRLHLPYLDQWQACPICGAPYGRLECSECNSFSLASLGREHLPFDRCVSVMEHSSAARRIILGYKDAGERRLAGIIAEMMADCLPPSWPRKATAITFIPATRKARRIRGFDHGEEIARELAVLCGLPVAALFERPASKDQRALSRRERIDNMNGRFDVKSACLSSLPPCLILVDDVYTTGATLFAASDALRSAGVKTIFCVTLSRVW